MSGFNIALFHLHFKLSDSVSQKSSVSVHQRLVDRFVSGLKKQPGINSVEGYFCSSEAEGMAKIPSLLDDMRENNMGNFCKPNTRGKGPVQCRCERYIMFYSEI